MTGNRGWVPVRQRVSSGLTRITCSPVCAVLPRALALLLLLVGAYYAVRACEIDFAVATFTFKRHPDFPRTQFLSGRLGVVQPTYARTYLYLAYRQLKGWPFNAAEREQVRSYWQDRGTSDWDALTVDWLAAWLRARKRIPGAGPEPPSLVGSVDVTGPKRYQSATFEWQADCVEDAFRTATATLADRKARFGADSPWVRDWLAAQDKVFGHCFENNNAIPAAPAPNMPAVFRADRAYQIAAAHFYSGNYDTAAGEFRRISLDKNSQWRLLSSYLVARALDHNGDKFHAEEQLKQILANPSLASIHTLAASLLRQVRKEEDPAKELNEVAWALMQRHNTFSLREDLWEFRELMNYFLNDDPWDMTPAEEREAQRAQLPRQTELVDWIVTFQGQDKAALDHAIGQWRASHQLIWLVAAMSHVPASHPNARELIEASLEVPQDSPGYVTLAFHRNRLRIEGGDASGAREELSRLLDSSKDAMGISSQNLFRSLEMRVAPDLVGFLKFAQRTPVMVTSQINVSEDPMMWTFPEISLEKSHWDRDSIKVLNERTPLALWRQAVLDGGVPDHLRQELTLTAFARAVLLNDAKTISQLAPAVQTVLPIARSDMDRLLAEDTAEGRHFQGVAFILKYSEIRPYLSSGVNWSTPSTATMNSYDRSWWCGFEGQKELDWDTKNQFIDAVGRTHRSDAETAARQTSFLSVSDVAAGREEVMRMAELGTAPNYFAKEVLAWVGSHPNDDRLPEALHYVVLAARYGCVDARSGALAKTAFQVLHSRYGKSIWAKRTPYWFQNWYEPANQ